MRFPPVSDIKRMRKYLDVTQSELARESGVSQSTIAKIESGKASASYETVVKIFEALERMRDGRRTELRAADVASEGVVSVSSSDKVREASDLMMRTGYSQLPVIDDGVCVGSISERRIFDLLTSSGSTMEDISHRPIDEVMAGPYPVVPESTPISSVTGLLEGRNAVLVSRKGRIVGLITSADMLKLVRRPGPSSRTG